MIAGLLLAGSTAACATSDPGAENVVPTLSAPTATDGPPPTTPPPPSTTTDDTDVVIVLDPGHNGANALHPEETNRIVDIGNGTKACNSTGTETNSGIPEAQVNWEITQLARSALQARGWTVILTRDSNDGWGPCIDQRAAVGNGANADAVVSIHADGGPPEGSGFHVIVPAELPGLTDDIVAESARLGDVMRSALLDAGFTPATYLSGGGLVVRDDLGGLNLSDVPIVFAELGNLRNADDARLLTSPDGQQQAADAIVDGLARFLGQP